MLPTVTRALIIINVLVFFAESQLGDSLIMNFALWPIGTPQSSGTLGFQPWQIVTYSFLHGGFEHIFFNMFALFMFGGQVELLIGAKRYFNLYFASVITAALTQLAVAALAGGEPYPTLGASGGVFGLLLAYGYYFPNRMVMLVIPPIPMRARTLVIVYGALELFLGVTGAQASVAHFAHLGGMLGAWLVIKHWRGGGPQRLT
ncbi:MAG TPA: rhomboid family intramembrane serine protease [Burkholderiales bacterium]|nr:rhomboid family intramembrane serine protease [Burkholderiales bacterium]